MFIRALKPQNPNNIWFWMNWKQDSQEKSLQVSFRKFILTVWFRQCSFDPTYLNRTNLMIECHIRFPSLEIFCSNSNCFRRYARVILLLHFLQYRDWQSVTSHAVLYLVSEGCWLCRHCRWVQHHQSFLASCCHQLESSWSALIYRGFSDRLAYSRILSWYFAVQQDWCYAMKNRAKTIVPSLSIAIHDYCFFLVGSPIAYSQLYQFAFTCLYLGKHWFSHYS